MNEIPNHIRGIISLYLISLREHGVQIQDAIFMVAIPAVKRFNGVTLI